MVDVPPNTVSVAMVIACVVFTALAGAGVWDIYCLILDRQGETVSEVIRMAAMRWPAITLFVGILAGHLFWH